MAPVALAEFCITPGSHERFGEFSGDLNPLHADQEAARQMEPGGILAYGMDLVLRSLEALLVAGLLPEDFRRFRVRFPKWVLLGDELALYRVEGAVERYELRRGDVIVALLELFGGEPVAEAGTQCEAGVRTRLPHDLTMEQMEGRAGVAGVPSEAEVAELYPRLAERLGTAAVGEMATCSYVIGMEAPGLYSMSIRYDLSLYANGAKKSSRGLGFRVTAVDPRFRKVNLAVEGTGIVGTLEAIVRKSDAA